MYSNELALERLNMIAAGLEDFRSRLSVLKQRERAEVVRAACLAFADKVALLTFVQADSVEEEATRKRDLEIYLDAFPLLIKWLHSAKQTSDTRSRPRKLIGTLIGPLFAEARRANLRKAAARALAFACDYLVFMNGKRNAERGACRLELEAPDKVKFVYEFSPHRFAVHYEVETFRESGQNDPLSLMQDEFGQDARKLKVGKYSIGEAFEVIKCLWERTNPFATAANNLGAPLVVQIPKLISAERSTLIEGFCDRCHLRQETVQAIVNDLTYDPRGPNDPRLQPLLPLSEERVAFVPLFWWNLNVASNLRKLWTALYSSQVGREYGHVFEKKALGILISVKRWKVTRVKRYKPPQPITAKAEFEVDVVVWDVQSKALLLVEVWSKPAPDSPKEWSEFQYQYWGELKDEDQLREWGEIKAKAQQAINMMTELNLCSEKGRTNAQAFLARYFPLSKADMPQIVQGLVVATATFYGDAEKEAGIPVISLGELKRLVTQSKGSLPKLIEGLTQLASRLPEGYQVQYVELPNDKSEALRRLRSKASRVLPFVRWLG